METTTNTVEMTTEKTYTLRALEAKDVFIMSKILGAIGIKEFAKCFESDSIKRLLASVNSGDNGMAASVGIMAAMDVAGVVFNNLPKCEKDIYTFLSNLSGMDKKAIESLPMVTFTEMIVDVIKKEEFKGFLSVVSKLFK